MPDATRTSTTTALLEALCDPGNECAWRELDERYRPVLFGMACRLGLSDADAADAAQEVMTAFFSAYRADKYDRARGRLGAWIIGIARNRIADFLRKRDRRRELRGESAILGLPDEDQLTNLWDEECRLAALSKAVAELASSTRSAPHTLEAFKRYVVQGRPPEEVAEGLGMTTQAVHQAKHRCLNRLREILPAWRAAYDLP